MVGITISIHLKQGVKLGYQADFPLVLRKCIEFFLKPKKRVHSPETIRVSKFEQY